MDTAQYPALKEKGLDAWIRTRKDEILTMAFQRKETT
jgi:hypothetical protein